MSLLFFFLLHFFVVIIRAIVHCPLTVRCARRILRCAVRIVHNECDWVLHRFHPNHRLLPGE
jgi:hypothetical protein